MLPTDKHSVLSKQDSGHLYNYHKLTKTKRGINQNLYIVTDDEIKEGRTNFFTYDPLNKKVHHIDYIKYFGNENGGKGSPENGRASFITMQGTSSGTSHKEIIATTDPELNTWQDFEDEGATFLHEVLPQPSKAFIEKYCEVGGIDEVDVEYEDKGCPNYMAVDVRKGELAPWIEKLEPKVDSHNTITIHPIKDSWSREEVIQLFRDYQNAKVRQIIDMTEPLAPLEWIKEKL